ncbi:hypothetical protein BV898_04360 [Hypsibius exemplaris]|uniref:Nucleolar protein 12 n=1 Tax=Hypsibius exemplaris TaxID=2072580 RepID=A0A1W0X393_HYPEX|nr:hypothetical protein BV898_04360 [Hypsibius exemplaris]
MAKKKLTVTFNESDRRDYLLGFRKRKNERRTVAKDKIEKKLIEERKAIRAERRKQNGGAMHVFPQHVEDLLSTVKEQTIDLPTHSVTITQMDDLELAQEDVFLGRNHFSASAPLDVDAEDGEAPSERSHGRSTSGGDRESNPKKLKALEKMMARLKGSNKHRGGKGVQGRPGRPDSGSGVGKGSKPKRTR